MEGSQASETDTHLGFTPSIPLITETWTSVWKLQEMVRLETQGYVPPATYVPIAGTDHDGRALPCPS